MIARIVFVVAVAGSTGACVGSGCNAPDPPSSDICELRAGAPAPAITSVEIGQIGPSGAFEPFQPNDEVPIVIGGQGSAMMVVNLRVRGSGVGSCLAQQTYLEELTPTGTQPISSEEAPLRTVAAGPGTWITGDALMLFWGERGQMVRLRARVGTATANVDVWADMVGEIDGPPPDCDCVGVDAAPDA